MKQKEVFKKIGGIIQELSEQYEYLQTVKDDLNDLELELFVSNAHFLTDHIEILCKLNLQNNKVAPPVPDKQDVKKETKPEKYFEPMVQQMKFAGAASEIKAPDETAKPVKIEETATPVKIDEEKPVKIEEEKPVKIAEEKSEIEDGPQPEIDLTPEDHEETYSYIQEQPEMIRHELILDEAENWDDDEQAHYEEETSQTHADKNESVDAEILAEVPEQDEVKPDPVKEEVEPAAKEEKEVITINQKMSSQLGDKGISNTEQLSIQPISDLKTAITLNDKLSYVKDLFNGYNLAYSEAIEILNRFNTFEEATRFLKTNYITKNNWEGKPATTEKFYALLKRRYA